MIGKALLYFPMPPFLFHSSFLSSLLFLLVFSFSPFLFSFHPLLFFISVILSFFSSSLPVFFLFHYVAYEEYYHVSHTLQKLST